MSRLTGSAAGAGAGPGKPNVVLVVLDDLDASGWQALPWTRAQIQRQGTWYPNFFVNTPTCGPSRATLLTGQMAHNHKVLENAGEDGAWKEFQQSPSRDRSLQASAQRAGYYTSVVGKLLNGSPDSGSIGPHFDQWFVSNQKEYFNFDLNENGEMVRHTGSSYSTTVLAQKALGFIEAAPENRPFFLLFAVRAPKIPAAPERKFRRRFRDEQAPRTPAWNEVDLSDKPENVRRRASITPEMALGMDAEYRNRLRSLLSVDVAIRQVADAARARGDGRGTIFVVLTDNGYAFGAHRLEGKGYPYDVIARCPMGAWGPGIPEAQTDERLVAMADVAPTLAALIGLRNLRADGIPFTGSLQHESVLIEKGVGLSAYVAVRSRDELYVEHGTGEREYYDYLTDPWELDNRLANWEGHTATLDPAKVSALAARAQALRTCAGLRCR